MKKTYWTLLLLLSIIIYSCSSNTGEVNSKDENIKVSWEVVSNTFDEQQKSKQIFTIENRGEKELTSKNWSLFYNQTPREVFDVSDKSKAVLESIRGDWFRLKLREGESLKPGEEMVVEYILSHWHIKETDGPKGLYSVYYDEEGKEEKIAIIEDYTIKPFANREQTARHHADRLPFYTPKLQYDLNKGISLVEESKTHKILPMPSSVTELEGEFKLNNTYTIVASDELKSEAGYLAKKLSELIGTSLNISNTEVDGPGIMLSINPKGESQSYNLKISDNQINITGGSTAGVFYGVQSLLNYIPLEYYKNDANEVVLGNIEIKDSPRFEYRGFHLDVSRNFQTKEQILKVIDIMAFYKLNAFHFYITEDEGWRLEIEELPELTQVGAKRSHTFDELNSLQPAYGSGPFADSENSFGTGYYSREDYIEILKYAQERHVDVIPSINFPGHARAAVISMEARYHRLMEEGKVEEASEFRLVHPEDKSEYASVQYYTDNVVDVGLESTYHFFETVVDDVIEIYKEAGVELSMIHTGGDEVPNGVWTESPACKELMKTMPEITDPKNLQQYFFKRISDILTERGLDIGGWEEVALTKSKSGRYEVNPEFVDKKVYPYVWNNLGTAFDLTHRMANAGYPVIYCGVTNLYFDMAYNNDALEPGYYWGGFVNERTVWNIAPFNLFQSTTHDAMGSPINEVINISDMEELKPEARKNIYGLQAELWSETVKGGEMMEYYLLPKLISFAERAWAEEAQWEAETNKELRESAMNKEWNVFINSLTQKELPRLNYLNSGYNYRVPTPGALVEEGLLYVNHEYPGMKVYYTTDGTEPNAESTVYSEPVQVNGIIRLKAIDGEGKESRTIEIEP